MKKIVFSLLFCLFAAIAQAQITVEVQDKILTTGFVNPQIVSQSVVSDANKDPIKSVSSVALVVSGQGNISIKIEDKDRNQLVQNDIVSSEYSLEGKKVYLFTKPGKYWVYLEQREELEVNGRKLNLITDNKTVIVEVKGIVPPGPTPPGPTPPGPVPPNPNGPPIEGDGFKVLIVVEHQELGRLSADEQLILRAFELRSFLESNCIKDSNGRASWRMLDDDSIFPSGKEGVWKAALDRPRTELPWILISNGTTGFEGPLPDTLEETMSLLKQYLPE